MKIIYLFLLSISIYIIPSFAYASTISGTISSNSYAWGENIGWINFGCSNCSVNITDAGITGNAWSSQYGWINLSPTNGGVLNNGEGVLSGNAWSSGLGWINFNGAVISNQGKLTGIVGNQASRAGRVNFDCTNCSVVTDWRPISVRNATSTNNNSTTTNSGGNGSGGSSGSGGTVVKPTIGHFPITAMPDFEVLVEDDNAVKIKDKKVIVGSSTDSDTAGSFSSSEFSNFLYNSSNSSSTLNSGVSTSSGGVISGKKSLFESISHMPFVSGVVTFSSNHNYLALFILLLILIIVFILFTRYGSKL